MTAAMTAAAAVPCLFAAPALSAEEPVTAAGVSVTVDVSRPGAAIPKSFLGFSMEHHDVLSYTGSTQGPNELFARMVGTLTAYGNGAPTIRIGGNSTDQSWWNPARVPRPGNIFTDLDGSWAASLGAFVSRTRTPVILGVNLALNDARNGIALAEAVKQALPAGTLRFLEVGNEPDLFARPRTFYVGRRLLRRPQHRPSYTYEQYTGELDSYLSALSPIGTALIAGGFATSGWDPQTGPLLDSTQGRIGAFSVHSYPLSTCGPARRRSKSHLIARLLGNRQAVRRLTPLAAQAAARGIPLHVTESGSGTCGGVKGMSDTFASALWGLNSLFGYLRAGAAGLDLHTWTGAFYAPLEFRSLDGRQVAIVRPLFYGMLMFARATTGGGQLLEAQSNRRSRVRVWATRNPAGTVRVVLVNASERFRRRASVRVPGFGGSATVDRLIAPSLHETEDVRLAGKTYGRVSTDGLLHGRHAGATVARRRDSYAVILPPASATLLTLRAQPAP